MNELFVYAQFDDESRRVGVLVQEDSTIKFQYAPSWLAGGANLSPLKLRWAATGQQADTSVFDGLFGVFADSLPDGWGRLILDRALVNGGTNLNEITMLDRLAYVGSSGRGSLTYQPANPSLLDRPAIILLDELAAKSTDVLLDKDLAALPELLRLGGSSGGARPKIHVLYNPVTGELRPDAFPAPTGFEAWIIKFSATYDPSRSAAIEYAYYQAARQAGIEMAESRLFTGKSGQQYFGTRRFDRPGEARRLHVHSLAGLVHDNFRLPALDYGHAMDATFQLEHSVAAYRKVLRIAAFNVFAHNRDDHSNNLSFLMDEKGNWQLAPAYDLTFSRPAHGEHSLTVAGEGRRPGRSHLIKLAEHFAVANASEILDEVWEAVQLLSQGLERLGVNKSIVTEIRRHLDTVE